MCMGGWLSLKQVLRILGAWGNEKSLRLHLGCAGHVGGSKVDIAPDGSKLAAMGRDGQCRQMIVV